MGPFYHKVHTIPECCGNCILFKKDFCIDANEPTTFDYKCDFYKHTDDYKKWNEGIEKMTGVNVNKIITI